MSTGNYVTAADALDQWKDAVITGTAPILYPLGTGELSRIEIGPGLVSLIGGAPGSGKTAFTMQCITDALRMTPTLRALVCNVEMPPDVLLDRQLSRLSGVDLTAIRYRRFGRQHGDRIDQGINTLSTIADRLCFLRAPFDLENVAAAADDLRSDLIVLDYIQRFNPPGEHGTRRNSVDATMNYLRQFADAGVAVIVVSAVSRAKDAKGRSSYSGDGLNLASFRESSELEFGCDDARILHPDEDDSEGDLMKLRHLKSRHGECLDLSLRFDRARQAFTHETDSATTEPAEKRKLTAALTALWSRSETSPDLSGGDDE